MLECTEYLWCDEVGAIVKIDVDFDMWWQCDRFADYEYEKKQKDKINFNHLTTLCKTKAGSVNKIDITCDR